MRKSILQTLISLYRRWRRILLSFIGKDIRQSAQIHVRSERYGSTYGGWTVETEALTERSTVYSFGIGEDISFDLALIDAYGLIVHAFDPTPRSIEWLKTQQLPEQFVLHTVGLANFDGTATFHPPVNPAHVSYSIEPKVQQTTSELVKLGVRCLKSIMTELGHTSIDLLKMDIEGSEYDVIQDLLIQNLSIRQILVEFHHRFPSIGIQKTREAVRSLNNAGYRIFFVSDTGEEYSFLKLA